MKRIFISLTAALVVLGCATAFAGEIPVSSYETEFLKNEYISGSFKNLNIVSPTSSDVLQTIQQQLDKQASDARQKCLEMTISTAMTEIPMVIEFEQEQCYCSSSVISICTSEDLSYGHREIYKQISGDVYSLYTGQKLKLSDMFNDMDAAKKVIKGYLGKMASFDMEGANFYLTSDALVIIQDTTVQSRDNHNFSYQVQIPKSSLAQCLRSEYR